MHKAIGIYIACMHSNRQIISLQNPKFERLILELILALWYFENAQFLKTRLVLDALF